MRPDAILFLISQTHLSGKRHKALAAGLTRACPLPCAVARMEGRDGGVPPALDTLAAQGARSILVQPVGLPFSDSLLAWLPGALAQWQRERGPHGLGLALGADLALAPEILDAVVGTALAGADTARPVDPHAGSIDGAGWDAVPPFTHHLLVCTGPRCVFRGSAPLVTVLNAELTRAGLSNACLVVTTGCLFPCNAGPVLVHYPAGRWYRLADDAAVAKFVSTVLSDTSLPSPTPFFEVS